MFTNRAADVRRDRKNSSEKQEAVVHPLYHAGKLLVRGFWVDFYVTVIVHHKAGCVEDLIGAPASDTRELACLSQLHT